MVKGSFRVGTSGYSYAHWREVFYPVDLPQRAWLEFYARHYDTVEINMTFYSLPRDAVFDGWRRRTPAGFLFALKGSRFITHLKALRDGADEVRRLRDGARRLEEKLGPVLWQLPPGLHADLGRLEDFLSLLRREWADARHAVEFRHESWLDAKVYAALRSAGASLCLADLGASRVDDVVTAPLVYIRRHGPGRRYRDDYPPEALRADARRIAAWLREGRDVVAYFNNDIQGHALHNAHDLRENVRECLGP